MFGRKQSLSLALFCAASVGMLDTQVVHAYDITGVGVGADVSLGGPSGAAVNIGLGKLELEIIAGLSMDLGPRDIVVPTLVSAFGVFVNVAETDTTNFQLGGRVGGALRSYSRPGPDGPALSTYGSFTVEGDARLEHRLDEHAVLIFQVGVVLAISPDDTDPIGNVVHFGLGETGLVGSAGFRWYFDALGGGSPRAAAPVRASSPPPASTAPATSDRPYWEQ